MIKVSVIVPVYNVEKYLDKCLNSLVNQTLKDIEIIVINDGSTDNSKKIIDKYKKEYPALIKSVNTKNRGIGPARNLGIKKATGKYITFVDSDDYLKEDALEKAFNHIKENNSDIVIYDWYEVNDKYEIINEVTIKSFLTTPLNNNKELLFLINPGPCNKLYKRELFKDISFPESKIKYEDLMTIIKVLVSAKRISKLDEKIYYYLIRANGETKTVDKRVFDILEVLDNINNYFKDKKVYDEYYQELVYLNIKNIMFQVVKQRYSKDRKTTEKFIEEAYCFLNKNFPKWKRNIYYKSESLIKRLIQNNKILLNIYFKLYKRR